MSKTIENTSVELYPRQPVQIRAPFSRMLKILSNDQHRSMSNLVEFWIEQEWLKNHPQSISISEELERG